MAKISLIGAGSRGFAKGFLMDIMTRPALAGCTLALMDNNRERLQVMTTLARKMAKQLDVPTRIESTLDLRPALDGADYVISIIRPPGVDSKEEPLEIAKKYGVDQAVGCTTGPNGVFTALKYMPPLLEIIKTMEEVCPQALFLHYSNPTTSLPWILNRISSIRSVGMCHSVQGTAMQLAGYIGAPYAETGHWVAGINHQAWFLRFEWNGEDAYPLVREKMADSEIYERDIVRFEMMRYFGHFLTESSTHNSEYVPYFRRSPEMVERFRNKRGPGTSVGLHVGSVARWKQSVAEKDKRLRAEAYGDGPIEIEQSDEYSVGIINAMETNEPYRFNGNVMNTGLITNLPEGCCVEVPCLVDNMGVHPCFVGDLPPQCASLNRNRLAGDELTVKGALDRDRKAIEQAIALDPLTAAVCTLDQIHAMTEEIFAELSHQIGEYT
jgi:alpha-galactosidase